MALAGCRSASAFIKRRAKQVLSRAQACALNSALVTIVIAASALAPAQDSKPSLDLFGSDATMFVYSAVDEKSRPSRIWNSQAAVVSACCSCRPR